MARTPLFRALKRQLRIAQSQHASHRKPAGLGCGPAQPSRRTFIGQAATLLATASLPGRVLAAPAKPLAEQRIAIVGGGIAGLACALKLRDHGVKATIYEGSPRIGGRMFSLTQGWEAGQVSEWCGELIDSGHKTLRGLAKRFGLELDNLLKAQPKGSEDTFFLNGDFYPAAQFQIDVQPVLAAAAQDAEAADYPTRYDSHTEAGHDLDHMSIRQWINSRVPGGMSSPLGKLLDLAYAIEYGADTDDQSALNLLYLLAYQPSPQEAQIFGESDEAFHIRGGNDRLPQAIAAELGCDAILLRHQLKALRKRADGAYQLDFVAAQGQAKRIEADIVVLALPFAVLRELDLAEAGFDALKLRAIRELGAGRNGKTQLQFDHRIWNGRGAWPGLGTGSSYSDTGYQSGWDVTRAQPGRPGIMNFYSGGTPASEQKTNASGQPFTSAGHPLAKQDAETALHAADKVYPGLKYAWNGRFTQSLPHLHPLFRASYAYYRVGQYTTFAGYEGQRQGHVHFCGEHTSQDFQGYMEGGATEGQRVAREILKG